MEPELQLLSEKTSQLLDGSIPNEETTFLLDFSLTNEKKRYEDTLQSAKPMCVMLKSGTPFFLFCVLMLNKFDILNKPTCGVLHTESSKIKEVYEVLMPLKPWLAEQQHILDTMRPAAVLTAPLTNQITETNVRTLQVMILAYTILMLY